MRGRERERRWEDRRARARQTIQSRGFSGHENQFTTRKEHGRREPWGYDRGIYNQATPFFFTNFPDDWSYGDMWRTFLKFGRVYAIHSPQRKGREGSRFGFVRFLEVRDEWELERRLNGIVIESMKLRVNRPRYNETQKATIEERRKGGKLQQQRSYVDVVKDGREEKEGAVEIKRKSQMNRTDGQHKFQAWRTKERSNNRAGLELKTMKEDEEWLQDCMVGTVHSIEVVPLLQERFYMEGYFTCKVRPMGGKLVLLEGGDKDELRDLVELAADWLAQWFEEIQPWKLLGIPPSPLERLVRRR
ncbi:hypothetical protein SLEP1_g4715 [Rubroshorea leprosula]|uniref:RRM domain-containing protein n=1 Tax=Rubroshorea leprosula TaxID=152421 RepID=A0AAV5HZ36_9ROSI|nr:hypothetical protein SLEP1_g4715 [Rubroshorea leprosula]